MNQNGNFGLVLEWGEILLTYMIFVYHWTFNASRTSRKMKKRPKKSKAIAKATAPFIDIL